MSAEIAMQEQVADTVIAAVEALRSKMETKVGENLLCLFEPSDPDRDPNQQVMKVHPF